jgi:type III restriction enzyme
MKLQFDSTQTYQLEAIQAVVDIFEGQTLTESDFQATLATDRSGLAFTDTGIANQLLISEAQILENVKKIQTKFNDANRYADGTGKEKYFSYIEPTNELKPVKTDDGKELTRLNFTVEMETGTGKTYTFLRTIYELNKTYGFKKFVIVVPSVAIREGTIKNLSITHEHFQTLYGNTPINSILYESSRLAELRNFAMSNAIQILVINIDSFTKDTNIINTVRETGIKPIEYIQATNPIVIVDEPQNMETDIRKTAIHNLNPLCTLRYSATNKNFYNLIYNLNPVQAYDLGLVKQIEVDGITADNNYNAAFIDFKGIQQGKRTLKTKLGLYVDEGSGVKQKDFNVDLGQDLYELSGERGIYRDGFILNNINAEDGYIEFSGGLVMKLGEAQGGLGDDIMKFQIERTVKWHFEKLKKHKGKGIKILSLIFIDKVANYREYDEGGSASKGKFAIWFEEIYQAYASKPLYKGLLPFTAEQVHEGYFSQDNKGKIKDTRGTTEADKDTYSLIMKNKEQLLSIDEPLQFIFSHSALREGWDNPNVFQICTLNETTSEMKKRQEIGRGLRLPVDSTGKRIQDKNINVLTLVANETYEDFSRALQSEIEEETSVKFEGRIKNTRERRQIKLAKELTPVNCPLFFEIWDKIKHRTRYKVEFSTSEVITKAAKKLKDTNQFPKARKPVITASTALLQYQAEGITGTLRNTGRTTADTDTYLIPDVYSYVQSQVDISRYTTYEVISQSGRAGELLINPQMFLDNVVAAVKQTLNELLVEGIKYERINGASYEMKLFEAQEIEAYLSNLFEVTRDDKTLYNYIEIDSNSTPERDFARDCEADESVKFFFKLPRGFKIPTPLGNYNPDWAVIFENDQRIYFVVETKGTLDKQKLREVEKLKIECGEKHFAVLDVPRLNYKLAVTNKDLH